MKRIRHIHLSAALFVGILIAFTLPFGYSAQSCGSQTKGYRGGELLVAHVEPDGDPEYAEAVSQRGLLWGWLLVVAALFGLRAAVLKRGRRWATWRAAAASVAFLLYAVVIDAGETRIGWYFAFCLPASGVVLKILIALGGWIWRRLGPQFAPAVTTPDEPAVR